MIIGSKGREIKWLTGYLKGKVCIVYESYYRKGIFFFCSFLLLPHINRNLRYKSSDLKLNFALILGFLYPASNNWAHFWKLFL